MGNVIGISIGSKNVGIAVIHLRTLIDCRIRTIPGKWTPRKCDSITEIADTLMRCYAIKNLAIKIPDKHHCSENTHLLVREIENIAVKYGVETYSYSINDLKAYFLTEKGGNRIDLAAAFIGKYPELVRRKWKTSQRAQAHNARLFEAIACAELALRAGH